MTLVLAYAVAVWLVYAVVASLRHQIGAVVNDWWAASYFEADRAPSWEPRFLAVLAYAYLPLWAPVLWAVLVYNGLSEANLTRVHRVGGWLGAVSREQLFFEVTQHADVTEDSEIPADRPAG